VSESYISDVYLEGIGRAGEVGTAVVAADDVSVLPDGIV
jgi:hypothetical protein